MLFSRVVGGAGLLYASYVGSDPTRRNEFAIAVDGVRRFSVTTSYCVITAIDYKWSLRGYESRQRKSENRLKKRNQTPTPTPTPTPAPAQYHDSRTKTLASSSQTLETQGVNVNSYAGSATATDTNTGTATATDTNANTIDASPSSLQQLKHLNVNGMQFGENARDLDKLTKNEKARLLESAREKKMEENQAAEVYEYRKDPEYKAKLHQANLRAARRLYKVCYMHAGVYTKFGQYVSTMNAILPQEFIDILSPLTDKAKGISSKEALDVVRSELGVEHTMEELFQEFDEEPVAAASLAQVHRAVTKEGREVAVKIQYPHLKKQVDGDLFTMQLMARAIAWAFPGTSYEWLFPEFRSVATLEMDFVQEGRNSQRVAQMFKGNNRVYVPAIDWKHTTSRVLVMDYVHGCRIDKLDKIKDMGFEPKNLASIVLETFGNMYFVHGLVHADPHAGNLMVRPTPGDAKTPQLVLLDHGMYRRLKPDVRRTYCTLWKGLLLRDNDLTRRAAISLGFPESDIDSLSLVLTYRPATSNAKFGERISGEEKARLKEKYKDITAVDVNEFMQRFPRDILFVLRSTAIIRSINFGLGGSSRERFRTMGECAVRGLMVNSGSLGLEGDKARLAQQAIDEIYSDASSSNTDEQLERPMHMPPPTFTAPYDLNLPVDSELVRTAIRHRNIIGKWLFALSNIWTDLAILHVRTRLFIIDAVWDWASMKRWLLSILRIVSPQPKPVSGTSEESRQEARKLRNLG